MCVSRGVFKLFQLVACVVFAAVIFVVGGYVGKILQYQHAHDWEWDWWAMSWSMDFWEPDQAWILWGLTSLIVVVLILVAVNMVLISLGRGVRWVVCDGCLRCGCCAYSMLDHDDGHHEYEDPPELISSARKRSNMSHDVQPRRRPAGPVVSLKSSGGNAKKFQFH